MRRTIIKNAKKNFNSGNKIHKKNATRTLPTRGGIRL